MYETPTLRYEFYRAIRNLKVPGIEPVVDLGPNFPFVVEGVGDGAVVFASPFSQDLDFSILTVEVHLDGGEGDFASFDLPVVWEGDPEKDAQTWAGLVKIYAPMLYRVVTMNQTFILEPVENVEEDG